MMISTCVRHSWTVGSQYGSVTVPPQEGLVTLHRRCSTCGTVEILNSFPTGPPNEQVSKGGTVREKR